MKWEKVGRDETNVELKAREEKHEQQERRGEGSKKQ